MQSHAELSIKDHQALINLLEQRNDVEAANMITEHVKLFQRRVHHFILPSLDILDAVASFQEVQS
jgi:DNA-binding GntR family transcriptional regulator